MRNNFCFYVFSLAFLLLLIFGCCNIDGNDKFLFIVYLLTAYGTCSVTFLSIFPYRYSDGIIAKIYWKKDYILAGKKMDVLQMRIENVKNRKVIILDRILVWSANSDVFDEDKAYDMSLGGVKFPCNGGIEILPKNIYYVNYEKKDFSNMKINDLSAMSLKLITSSGQKFEVKNEI